MKIKEITYTETRKTPGQERFSSNSITIGARADITDETDKPLAMFKLKEFVKAQF